MTGRCLALALVLGLPVSGWAENLVLGFDSQTGWIDNLFFSEDDEEDAFPFYLSPWLELRRERGDLTYDLNLSVIYEDFFDRSAADTFDTVLRLNGNYHLNEATQFSFRNEFTRVQDLSRRLATADPTSDVVPDLENRRQRSLRNAASVGVRHSLSRRWRVNANLTNTLFDFRDDDLVDSNSVGLSTSFVYAISPRDQVGVGAGATQQDFDDTPQRPSSQTNIYRAFGSWSHVFSPTFTMSLQAGPTWIRTRSDRGGSDSRFTYFGAGDLQKRWETVTASLFYNRTDSSSSGASGSTVSDTVSGSVLWRPSPRWELAALGSWSRFESATTQFAQEFVPLPSPPFPPDSFTIALREIDSNDEVDQFRFELRGERRLTRHVSVFGNVTWLQQKRNISSFTNGNDSTDRFQAILGIRWRTRPFFF